MKKWIWLVVLGIVAVVVVGSRSTALNVFFEPRPSLTIVERIPMKTPQPQPPQAKSTPQVSAPQLLAHIENLNFQRFTPTERSRTRTYITTELRKYGWKPQLQKFAQGINVFAQRQGTDKKAGAILLAAHYDTVADSPGADDNASGVAVLLEIARLLGANSTPRTLQLAFFDKEEAGLLGSKAFVTKTEHLQNLRGVIVMDMLGYACYTAGCQKYPPTLPVTPPTDNGDFLVAIGDTEHLPLLKVFENSQTLNQKISNLPSVLTLPIPLKGLLTPDTLRSDHAPFWYQGVGAILVTDTGNLRTPHYHQPSDVPANIERSFFTGTAQIVVNVTNTLLSKNDNLATQPPT